MIEKKYSEQIVDDYTQDIDLVELKEITSTIRNLNYQKRKEKEELKLVLSILIRVLAFGTAILMLINFLSVVCNG